MTASDFSSQPLHDTDAPVTPDISRPPRPQRSLSRVSFSKETLLVQPPPRPHARTWVGKYITRDATIRVFRQKLEYGLNLQETASAFGRVATWSRKGGEADGVMWMTCCCVMGSCMIEQQRQAMETKLHRWHKERGACGDEGEPRHDAHFGSGGCCSLRWWPCTRAWLVAENVGALANFKAVQGLDGWPARNAWASPEPGAREIARDERERELQPVVDAPTVASIQRGLGSFEDGLEEAHRRGPTLRPTHGAKAGEDAPLVTACRQSDDGDPDLSSDPPGSPSPSHRLRGGDVEA